MNIQNALNSLGKIAELAGEIPEVADHIQTVIVELTELGDDVKAVREGVDSLLSFIHDLKNGAREAVNMGGMQGMMAKNLIPPTLLQ